MKTEIGAKSSDGLSQKKSIIDIIARIEIQTAELEKRLYQLSERLEPIRVDIPIAAVEREEIIGVSELHGLLIKHSYKMEDLNDCVSKLESELDI